MTKASTPGDGEAVPVDTRNAVGCRAQVEPALMTSVAAAALLGIKSQSLRKWRLLGTGPRYVRLGGPKGRVVYRRADIEAWLDARSFTSTSAEAAANTSRFERAVRLRPGRES